MPADLSVARVMAFSLAIYLSALLGSASFLVSSCCPSWAPASC